MAKELTLEQATRNMQGIQKVYLKAKKRFSVSKKHKDFVLMKQCEAELIYYNGYIEYEIERDKLGKPIRDNKGNFVRTDVIRERKIGKIQLLSNKAQELRDQSNLGDRFLNRTFENFDEGRNKKAFVSARAYSDRKNLFQETDNSRIFIGGVGTGKTHLAAAIANSLVERGIPVLFGTCSEHLAKVKSQFDTDIDGEYLSQMKNVPMLVIDDIGKERKTEWTASTLFDVINYRYEHLLPIVLTTNLSEEELPNHVGDAVASRLLETGRVIKTIGEDYRGVK